MEYWIIIEFNMKKTGLLIIILVLSAQIIRTVSAAPYKPPPSPVPIEPPLPPPEVFDEIPNTKPREYPTFPPTPTPCIPNFCFFQQTWCCFDSLCVFHGETDRKGNSRCLKLAPDDKTNPFPKVTQSVQSFFGMIISRISSIFGK